MAKDLRELRNGACWQKAMIKEELERNLYAQLGKGQRVELQQQSSDPEKAAKLMH